MTFTIDAASLAAIALEARQCFLEEDAPEHLQTLRQGLEEREAANLQELIRAAHSLKGGAGLAQLHELHLLTHKLEDLLQAFQQDRVADPNQAWTLLEWGVTEAALAIDQAHIGAVGEDVAIDPTLLRELAALELSAPQEEVLELPTRAIPTAMVVKALEEDLEGCLHRLETLDFGVPSFILAGDVESFVEECTVLGETLQFSWLLETIQPLAELVAQDALDDIPLAETIDEIIQTIRDQRTQHLQQLLQPTVAAPELSDLESAALELTGLDLEGIEAITAAQALTQEPLAETPDLTFLETDDSLETTLAEATSLLEEISPSLAETLTEAPTETQPNLQEVVEPLVSRTLRVPLKRLETMTSTVGELILAQERLRSQQKLLEDASKRLQSLTRQFEPVRAQVQVLYDELAIAHPSTGSHPLELLQPLLQKTNGTRNKQSNDSNSNAHHNAHPNNHSGLAGRSPLVQQGTSEPSEFDELGLDRFTALHSSLQIFQELMLQVQETRADIDLIARDLTEELEQNRHHLDHLYQNVNQSRLVPFKTLAQRFPGQIQNLAQRFGKSLDFYIQGEETLVDQVLLEQLQTPLTHLLNNAFDHGIETEADRLATHKSPRAQLTLRAAVDNSQLVVQVIDDGRGINAQKVYQRAVERGLCPAEKTFEQCDRPEILNWIFEPGFSTTDAVSLLSGRGAGLDIVKAQMRRLRGSVHVDTQPGEGTTFTLTLPVSLSLLSLFLCEFQGYRIALPTNDVLATLPYTELEWTKSEYSDTSLQADETLKLSEQTTLPTVIWREQTIPVVPLSALLPYRGECLSPTKTPHVAIALKGSRGTLIVTVDAILGENQLILKPLDSTVGTPPYLAGCTILGSGEVVPVILPQALEPTRDLPQAPINPFLSKPVLQSVPTVMVVEDSVATRQFLERLLAGVGLTVLACRDGREALDTLEQRRGEINLIISDVEMPRVNGLELLQKVRADQTYCKTPVLMVTSRTGDQHRQRAIELGASGYLGKPIQPQLLLQTIQPFLSVPQS